MNPNAVHGPGHWILYDFGNQYKFGQLKVWNTNDPGHLDWGLRDVILDVSIDGMIWTNVGEFTFTQASGQSIYEGEEGPDLDGVEGRFLLITAKNNWGGECFGLSEIRLHAEETVISSVVDPDANSCFALTAAPNPFVDRTSVTISAECPGEFEYSVIDMLGRVVRNGTHAGGIETLNIPLNLNDLPQGTYHMRVIQEGVTGHITLVKMQKT
jgi:hypothetical protein